MYNKTNAGYKYIILDDGWMAKDLSQFTDPETGYATHELIPREGFFTKNQSVTQL